MRPLVAHCHTGLGEAYVKTGLREEAHPELLTAIELYHCMNMAFWLPKVEAVLTKTTDSAQS